MAKTRTHSNATQKAQTFDLSTRYMAESLDIPITDPETGAPSTLTAIGTSIKTTVEEPVIVQQEGTADPTEGLVAFEAHKLVAVTEYLQG